MLDFLWIILLPTLCNYSIFDIIYFSLKKKKAQDETEQMKWNKALKISVAATCIVYIASLYFWYYATSEVPSTIVAVFISQLLLLPLISIPFTVIFLINRRNNSDPKKRKKYKVLSIIGIFIAVIMISLILILLISLSIGIQHM